MILTLVYERPSLGFSSGFRHSLNHTSAHVCAAYLLAPNQALKTCRRACRGSKNCIEFGVVAASDVTVNCSPLSEKL